MQQATLPPFPRGLTSASQILKPLCHASPGDGNISHICEVQVLLLALSVQVDEGSVPIHKLGM